MCFNFFSIILATSSIQGTVLKMNIQVLKTQVYGMIYIPCMMDQRKRARDAVTVVVMERDPGVSVAGKRGGRCSLPDREHAFLTERKTG